MPHAPLRLLTVAFDASIQPWELRAFRGAVSLKAGHANAHFHNHDNETGGFHYRLPLIQYKQDRGRPMLVCLNEGIEELHHFFSQPDWTLEIQGRQEPMRIAKLEVKQFNWVVLDRPHRYHIRQWIGLVDENYTLYTRLTGIVERIKHLERILQNQLVTLCHQLNFHPDTPVEVKITNLKEERWIDFKRIKMLAFSLEFEVNLFLPDYLGLGKGASAGWGVVKGLTPNKN